MPLPLALSGVIGSALSWLVKGVVIKALVMGVVFVVVAELTPLVIDYLGNLISPGGLTTAFSGIPPGVWFFLDFFALDFGLPLIMSAQVARFLIRRIPFIG